MAQFDVHHSPVKGRPDVPFVLVLQSSWFDGTPDRLVAPLVLAQGTHDLRPPPHMPSFMVAGRAVMADVLQCRPIPRRLLGLAVASLADEASATRIIAAIDEVISRGYG